MSTNNPNAELYGAVIQRYCTQSPPQPFKRYHICPHLSAEDTQHPSWAEEAHCELWDLWGLAQYLDPSRKTGAEALG